MSENGEVLFDGAQRRRALLDHRAEERGQRGVLKVGEQRVVAVALPSVPA